MKSFGGRLFSVVFGLFLVSNLILIEVKASNPANDKKQLVAKNKDKTQAPDFARFPVSFEENKGQSDASVKFLSRNSGYTLFLTAAEAVYQLQNSNCGAQIGKNKNLIEKFKSRIFKSKPCSIETLKMKFLGANKDAEVGGENLLPMKTNYFIGSDESRWLRDVPAFQSVRYRRIYEGVDAIFRGIEEQNLEYDFHIAPNADTNQIRLEFTGATKLKINRDGELVLKYKGGEIRHKQPFAYQIIGGEKRSVGVRFILLSKNLVGFDIAEYDKTKELVIDPIIYATYLSGSNGWDHALDVAVDQSGNVYVASSVGSTDFLNLPGAHNGYNDVFVTKFNSNNQILYNTRIGGLVNEEPAAIDVDANGNAYITGFTYSSDFPRLNAYQNTSRVVHGTVQSGFVTKLNAAGTIEYSTFLSGSCTDDSDEDMRSLDVDSNGNAYITGYSCSSNFPVRNGFQTALQGYMSAVLSKFDPTGQLLYSTYFGGSDRFFSFDVAADNLGNAYISGRASSGVFTTPGAYQTSGSGFVAKFNTTKTGTESLVYSTYSSAGTAIGIDADGNAYIAGQCIGGCDGGLFKLNATGSSKLYAVGTGVAFVRDIAVNDSGTVYLGGTTNTDEADDVIIKAFSSSDGRVIDMVNLGGSLNEYNYGIALGSDGYAYVAGYTESNDFPTTPDAFQPRSKATPGYYRREGYLAKLKVEREPLIFVPGIMGSEIGKYNSDGTFTKYWARPVNSSLYPFYHWHLTNNQNNSWFTSGLFATDVLRKIPELAPYADADPIKNEAIIYEPLINMLKNRGGFREYDVTIPLVTPVGCDLSQGYEKPKLFVFPYDWRQDNNTSAEKLKEFVQCVQQYYPNQKVNIIAHSMGGLVARRYILNNQSTHGVNKLITIASPFLGAPQALFKLETGGIWGWDATVISPPTVKFLMEDFKSAHQLLPSRWYRDLNDSSGGVLIEAGDVNNNGVPDEFYTYDQTIDLLNNHFQRTTPGATGKDFHNQSGQDDWRQDQSSVKYTHIIGEQNELNTPVAIVAKEDWVCGLGGNCGNSFWLEPSMGFGDGTVPRISAAKVGTMANGSRVDLNAPNATVYYRVSNEPAFDYLTEHTGLTKDDTADGVHDLLLYSLGLGQRPYIGAVPSFNSAETQDQSTQNPATFWATPDTINQVSHQSAYYLTMLGISEADVSDDLGNKIIRLDTGGFINNVHGLTYNVVGDNALSLVMSTVSRSYTVQFQTGNHPLRLEIRKGVGNGNPQMAIRYIDLVLPAAVKAQIMLNPQGVQNLSYDADGNGTFETVVTPTVSLSGSAATDITPPTLNINVTRQGDTATATITAQDTGSGVKNIRYSLDGTNFSVYTAPLTISYSPNTITVYAFADDNAANRSGLIAKTVYSNVSVSGTVAYGITLNGQTAKFIPEVSLTAAGSSRVSAVTAAGAYLLNNLTPNANYTVTPSKTGNINGISPFDATMVLRHVVSSGTGPDALNANQKIAADANGDGSITPFDATLILRYVAANAQSLNTAQVGNWKFNPNARNYPFFSGMLSNENYLGYLIGDVNGSWTLDFAAAPSAPQIQISLPQNSTAAQGSTIFVPVTLSNSNSVGIRSYSFRVQFDPAVLQPEYAGINVTGTLSADCSVTTNRTMAGTIGVASSCPISASSGTLINLRFTVVGQANTSTGASLLTFKFDSGDNPTPAFEDTNNNPIPTGLTDGQFTVTSPAAANSDDSISNEKSKDSSEGIAASSKAFVPEPTQQQQQQQSGAEGEIQISLPQNAAVTQGSVVTIPVTLTNSGGTQLSAYSFDVQFNPALLKAVEIIDTSGTLSSNCFVEANTIIPGRINIAGSCGNNSISASAGILVKLRFTVVGQANNAASEARALRFWQAPIFEDSNGHQIVVSRTNGSIR